MVGKQECFRPVKLQFHRHKYRFFHLNLLDAKAKDALHRPAPQPIETAPLGQILTWPCDCEDGDGPEWSIEWSFGRSLDEQRAELKKWGRTHWLPMPPPPPGGGK
jgi:hypothetical protein